jgi:hypothetical protein
MCLTLFIKLLLGRRRRGLVLVYPLRNCGWKRTAGQSAQSRKGRGKVVVFGLLFQDDESPPSLPIGKHGEECSITGCRGEEFLFLPAVGGEIRRGEHSEMTTKI